MSRKPLSGKMIKVRRKANHKRDGFWVEIPIEDYMALQARRKKLKTVAEPVKEPTKPSTQLETLESLLATLGYKRG